ncbi:MAG: histidine kinase, partial [Acidobacteria bacterium]
MPKMDGFALTAQIKRHPELANTKMVLLTLAGQRGDPTRCRELGITAYLSKPIRQSRLRGAILAALEEQAREGEVPSSLVAPRSSPQAATGSRILLAEDNVVNQHLAVRLLEKRGHRVRVAGSGREALAALDRERFDVVLMDVQMP